MVTVYLTLFLSTVITMVLCQVLYETIHGLNAYGLLTIYHHWAFVYVNIVNSGRTSARRTRILR